jgi:hypothetical protein
MIKNKSWFSKTMKKTMKKTMVLTGLLKKCKLLCFHGFEKAMVL